MCNLKTLEQMLNTCTTIVLPVVQKHYASVAKKLQECENVLGHYYICCFRNGIIYHFIRLKPPKIHIGSIKKLNDGPRLLHSTVSTKPLMFSPVNLLNGHVRTGVSNILYTTDRLWLRKGRGGIGFVGWVCLFA